MKLTQIESLRNVDKPARSIYGGVLYHGEVFSLDRRLFGNSPDMDSREHYSAAMRDVMSKRRKRVAIGGESSMVKGTIGESIEDAGLYPVQIVVETPSGHEQYFIVTKD